jgi:glycosyltransferase involved in cell wall biosynthesis
MIIKGKDIIVLGIQAWDIEIGSNCKNIATEMSRENRVLYVNSPLDRISKFKERKTEKIKKRLRMQSGKEANLVNVGSNIWTLYPKTTNESINWINSKRVFNGVNRMNTKKFTNDIKSAIDSLDFKDFILFNDSSMFLGQHLKEFLKPKIYVYYMRDYLTKNPYWKKHGVRLEPKLIKSADLIVNNSTLYAEYGAQFNKHSYMVGQGCDTSIFNDLEREIIVPKDFENLPKPIIGYVGFLSSRRLSIEIIEHMALAKPEWSIVLVGPEDDNFKASNLHNLTNVYFLGSRDSSELPNYIKGFDIAMNPQLINDATIGNYPRKIDEYLAMGKPTLASATKAMDYFKDYTYLGITKEDFVTLAEKALKENNENLEIKRRTYGSSHSWKNNVKEIYTCMQLVAEEKGIQI